MNRRQFVRAGSGADVWTEGERAVRAAPRFGTAGILDAGVREQQELMQAGKLTSHSLTSQYLARIKTIANAGPCVNAIVEINPEALKIALEMDRERGLKRLRGPLHGIPVLLKDNIATGDRMRTSSSTNASTGASANAGTPAPADARAARDAFVVAQLRAAGAVIIGKTNPRAWANMLPLHAVVGASPGSGAAIAAGLATLAVGTETDGSIVSPASICGMVGIKPTLGLVSRSGITPIDPSLDTAGPMARSVADAALMLAAMAGTDANDPATTTASDKAADYRAALDKAGLRGARIGVARNLFGNHAELDVVIEKALVDLKAQGAVLVDSELPNAGDAREAGIAQLMREHSLDALVAPTGGPVWRTDSINGGQAGAGFPSPVAVAGCPHITVPAGQVYGQPVGLSFVGAAFSEAKLIGMAYAFEQATLHRRAPRFPASLALAVR
ncbi:amidase family protein [Rugamonas apoptosis]|uniref:Amidase n=1 Tax=Rugamonas apoptosis TaxID=2758570 RepID=A0A7W2F8M3_9BURK|nr:amidase family protein [Rugamonas apoptosis]MBA5687142.1 amidase [Rugamonas apoptosis]